MSQSSKSTGGGGGASEGTAVLSTGETGATKFLREDGDGTSSWQPAAGTGSVTSVTAGTGMTQSGTSTVNPTLNIVGGDGITANADDIAHTAHTGDVTGATALTIATDAVVTAKILDDNVTAAKLANSINTDIATGVTAGTVAAAALPKAGGAMTGAITTNSTFDGVDVATRDGVLSSTTTTANAALPKAGGAMSGNITMAGSETVDGRDLSADGTKLDAIESSADVTDVTNVTAAGALMDSELAGIAAVKATTGTFLTADQTKLDGIETSATADQTNAEIATAVEAASDSNTFTDADHSKLDAIAANANNYTLPSASVTVVGGVELATNMETTDGADATRAVTPAGVQAAIDALVGGAPAALDTLNELAAAINDDESYASTITTALALKSTIASPTFTGTVAIPNVANLETAVVANTAKVTNVSTNLATTTSATTAIITSSDGTDATIPVATTSVGGVMSKAIFDQHTVNVAKNTNVVTNLTAIANGTSLTVISSDGDDVSLPAATTTAWGVMSDDQATKLDGIEASADVTDATNVTAAGALMDSECTDLAAVKATEDPFTAALLSKLNAIEASADVTDATNVASAGALMDSEVTNLALVKALAKGISDGNVLTANDVVADDDFLRINGTEVEGLTVAEVLTALNVEAGADVTDAANVTAAGALMDIECLTPAALKATTGTFLTADQTKLDGIEVNATADQSASEIKTLLEDGIDSIHYVDGSIDAVHLAADVITGAKIADNAIDSEHYTDGSIDNAHIADDAIGVDELSATGTASSSTFLRGDNSWAATAGSGDMTGVDITAGDGLTRTQSNTTSGDYTASISADLKANGGVVIESAELAVDLAASSITGTLAVSDGGTGLTSLATMLNANVIDTTQVWTKAQTPATQTASFSTTPNFDTYQNFIYTLASDANTFAAATTEAGNVGQTGLFIFIQPSTGDAGTVALHADYESVGGLGLSLSPANSAYDIVPYIIKADNSILLGAPQLAFS